MFMKISGTYSIYKNITLLRGRSFHLVITFIRLLPNSSVPWFEAFSKLSQQVVGSFLTDTFRLLKAFHFKAQSSRLLSY